MDIILQQVSKSYGQTPALYPLDLHIRSGEFTTLLGPSGCGKTTLLRMIAGLETPDTGSIQFGDQLIFSAADKVNKPVHKRGLGMVFQDFALWPHLTVFENVAFGLRAAKRKNELRERVDEAIRAVQLKGFENRYPHQLSGGQQQRVAFARAIAIAPKVILFDEPLSALDAALREEMRYELTDMVRSIGLTAVYVTHDQEEAMSMSDQIVVMQKGKILQKAPPQHVYDQPTTSSIARFIGKSNWLTEGRSMLRPERLLWEPAHGCTPWQATVARSTYIGGRYEISLVMQNGSNWIAYDERPRSQGDSCTVYVLPEHIYQIV